MFGLDDPDCPVDLQKLTASIKLHEGCRLKPYADTTGHLTIGWGRNLTVDGISQGEANEMLSNDLQSCIGTAETQPWWGWVKNNDARCRAFIEIAYNIGFAGLASFVNALGYASRGDWEGCAQAFLDSEWAQQVGQRARILAEMIKTGNDPI